MLVRVLKEPLAQFLAPGFGFLLLYAALISDGSITDDPKRIAVDDGALLTLIQYRTKTFIRRISFQNDENTCCT